MIASVKHGWQLSRLNSGMEDPRNWGIQLICMVGREIKMENLPGVSQVLSFVLATSLMSFLQ